MGSGWLLTVALAVPLCGCMSDSAPPARPPIAKPAKTRQPPNASGKKVEKRAAQKPLYRWPADFKLPLVIVIETPEVPREIRGPSPPIVEDRGEAPSS